MGYLCNGALVISALYAATGCRLDRVNLRAHEYICFANVYYLTRYCFELKIALPCKYFKYLKSIKINVFIILEVQVQSSKAFISQRVNRES